MPLHPVNPPGALIPGISQGMIAEGGRLLFLSGHVPLTAAGAVAGPELEDQLEQVFQNLAATLAQAGARLADVARLTLYVRDYSPEMLPTIRAVRDRHVDARRPPASALIGIAALFHPEVRVEIDAIALLPDAP